VARARMGAALQQWPELLSADDVSYPLDGVDAASECFDLRIIVIREHTIGREYRRFLTGLYHPRP
jgi:hypothetical protein